LRGPIRSVCRSLSADDDGSGGGAELCNAVPIAGLWCCDRYERRRAVHFPRTPLTFFSPFSPTSPHTLLCTALEPRSCAIKANPAWQRESANPEHTPYSMPPIRHSRSQGGEAKGGRTNALSAATLAIAHDSIACASHEGDMRCAYLYPTCHDEMGRSATCGIRCSRQD